MVLKTFNVEESVYEKYSQFCKENGISMSNQNNTFIKAQLETEPKVKEEYLKRLEAISKGKFIKIGSHEDFVKRYLKD